MVRYCLIPLVGLPASGKSSFANILKLCDSLNIIHVCYDNELGNREKYFQDLENKNYKTFRSLIIQLLEILITDNCYFKNTIEFINNHNLNLHLNYPLQSNNDRDIILIIDDNNYYRSMRYEFYKIAKKFEISFMEIYFECFLADSLIRNSLRNPLKIIPEHSIQQMYVRFEKPNKNLNWETNLVVIESIINIDMENILMHINKQLNNPETKKSSNKNVTNCSTIHKIDLQLRKCISNKMKLNTSFDAEFYAQELNLKRKQMLSDLRNYIIIPESIDEINQYF